VPCNLFEGMEGLHLVRRAPLGPVGGKAWAVLALGGPDDFSDGRCVAALAVQLNFG
jgi:hypothetical protein